MANWLDETIWGKESGATEDWFLDMMAPNALAAGGGKGEKLILCGPRNTYTVINVREST